MATRIMSGIDITTVQVVGAGYRNLMGEFEQYSRSVDRGGRPLRPEIYDVENNIHAGVKYLRLIRDQYFDDPELDEEEDHG